MVLLRFLAGVEMCFWGPIVTQTSENRHISQEDIQKNRDEVLNTSSGQIRDIAEILDAMMHKDRYCVLGNENRIKEESELFGELVKVFE